MCLVFYTFRDRAETFLSAVVVFDHRGTHRPDICNNRHIIAVHHRASSKTGKIQTEYVTFYTFATTLSMIMRAKHNSD